MRKKKEAARQLEKLRADAAALSDASGEPVSQSEEPTPGIEESTTVVESVAADGDIAESVKTQIEELGQLLEAEIRDRPAITCLVVFSLGILVGRLLR